MAAISLNYLRQKLPHRASVIFLFLFLLIPMHRTYLLATDPVQAKWPQEDKHGYFQEWTAGYGQKEVARYLITRAEQTKVFVGTEGYFGTLPDGLQIYTEKVPNLTIIGVGQPLVKIPEPLTNSLVDNEVYLVVNRSRNHLPVSEQTRLKLIATYDKALRPDGTHETLEFYQLTH